jgi:hypothetical protein
MKADTDRWADGSSFVTQSGERNVRRLLRRLEACSVC